MKSSSKRFISNIGWLMGGKIVNMILQFVVSLATARYLGPSNFGTINYVAAFVSFFSSIASLGLAVIVIKEISTNKYDNNEVVWTSIWLRFGTAILSTISIITLMFITNRNDSMIVQIAFLESLSILFSSFDTINYYFQAKLLSKWSSIAGVLAYIGMSLYRIYLLATGADIVWFAFATSTDMIFLTIFLMIFYVKIEGFRPKFNWNIGKRLLKQSYHYLIAGLITILYAQVDRIMLGNMLDKTSVGYYSAALTISTLWSMIPTALIQSISPVLYEAAGKDRTLYLRRLRQSYAVLFWLNAAYSIFVGVFAHWVILLLYGKDYLAGTAALKIVVWYYGLSTMSTLNQVYLANDEKNKYINLFCIVGLITDVILNFILIPVMGINGAAIATLITHIVIQIIVPYIYKDTREISTSIIQGALLRDVLNKEEIFMVKQGIRKLLKRK
nr:flippase [uncultured Mediterraneibacter sp.]